jgi:hypothetical protein
MGKEMNEKNSTDMFWRHKKFPNNWLIIKHSDSLFKIIAGFYDNPIMGKDGYVNKSFCKLNSGIESYCVINDHYEFKGVSGSIYICYKEAYGCSTVMVDKVSKLKNYNILMNISEVDFELRGLYNDHQ